jgi:hypothetical protein
MEIYAWVCVNMSLDIADLDDETTNPWIALLELTPSRYAMCLITIHFSITITIRTLLKRICME